MSHILDTTAPIRHATLKHQLLVQEHTCASDVRVHRRLCEHCKILHVAYKAQQSPLPFSVSFLFTFFRNLRMTADSECPCGVEPVGVGSTRVALPCAASSHARNSARVSNAPEELSVPQEAAAVVTFLRQPAAGREPVGSPATSYLLPFRHASHSRALNLQKAMRHLLGVVVSVSILEPNAHSVVRIAVAFRGLFCWQHHHAILHCGFRLKSRC